MLEKIDLSKKMDKDTYKQVIGEQSERLGLLQRELRTAGIPVMCLKAWVRPEKERRSTG